MAGTQFFASKTLITTESYDYSDTFELIKIKVFKLVEEYNLLSTHISYIQVNFIPLDDSICTRYRVDKSDKQFLQNFININFERKAVIPVSIANVGKYLYMDEYKGVITKLWFKHNGTEVDFLQCLIKNCVNNKLDDAGVSLTYTLICLNKVYCVLATKYVDNYGLRKLL